MIASAVGVGVLLVSNNSDLTQSVGTVTATGLRAALAFPTIPI